MKRILLSVLIIVSEITEAVWPQDEKQEDKAKKKKSG